MHSNYVDGDKLQNTTDPNISELHKDFVRSYSDERITYRVRESDETRFSTWNGQSRDGKKHARDLGQQPFPWEGASDTRIRLADEVCSFMVQLSTSALSRAALNVGGVEGKDHEDASAVGVYLRWMLQTVLQPDFEEELELHAEYAAQYGWSVLHTTWDRCYAQVPQQISLEGLARFMGGTDNPPNVEALQSALKNEKEYLADLLVGSNPGLKRQKALKHINEVAKTGKTVFDVPQMTKNQPSIVALRPYFEILFPPETQDWHRARAIFRRDYYTLAEIEEKATNGDWDEKFVEKIKRTAGKNSTIWDTGLSPVTGNSEKLDDRSNLVEIVHAYSRRVTENGNPGIYQTVFSPYMHKDEKGEECFAQHELVTEAGDTYPFECFTREKTRRSPIESRGVSEIVKTWQAEYKAQADQVFDRSSFDTLPPLRVPLRYGQRIKIGPGVQVSEQRPGDISWMDTPKRGADLAFQLMDQIQVRTDRYFGRPNAQVPPVETQLRQQAYVHRWLRHMSTVVNRMWDLTQRFDDDERFAVVTGTGKPIPRDPNNFNFNLHFDVRELDNEFVEKKLQAISQFVLPEDTMGIVDRTKLIRKKLQVIDPSLADELVIQNAEASQAMFEEVNSQVAYMALGNSPSKLVENDPAAAIKMQFLQQIIQNNPKYQQQLEADQQFQELLKMYSQNLNMSVMQQQNKQIGRLGVNPNA